MEELVDSNVESEGTYAVDDQDLPAGPSSFGRSAPEAAIPLNRGLWLIAIVLLSLGLWAAIWAAVTSVASSVLR